jgi:two-component system, OmpR family, alkaline phosphatase synthesis response regulator PhoP
VSTSENAKILIADDRSQGVELLEAYLSDTPYEIKTANNGEDTLRIVRDWHPDVILLDVMMPRISGFEVCSELRADPKTKDIGILMITALDQAADVDRGVAAGTDDFMTKPINKAELILRIKSLLQSRSESSSLARTLKYIRGVQQMQG